MCDPRLIRSARPGDIIKDDKVAGLACHVNATSKSWKLYYRTKTGEQRRPKLGEWPSMSPESARRVARAMLEEVAKGNDPSLARQQERHAETVTALWNRWREDHGNAKKSAYDDNLLWRQNIEPHLGAMRVADVQFDDIQYIHKGMTANGTPIAANRTLALLSTMFAYAYRPLRWTEDNPCKGVRRNPERKRRRYMKGDEAANIAAILKREEAREPASVAHIYLLIFTGARKGEIANATWEMYQGNRLHLPDSKCGERVIQLPPQAVELLDKLPKDTPTITGVLDPKKLWDKIRKEAGCPDLRMHDLRHSFASAAITAGLTLPQIGELLGHASTQTTARYAHLVEEAAQVAVTRTADVIERMLTPQT